MPKKQLRPVNFNPLLALLLAWGCSPSSDDGASSSMLAAGGGDGGSQTQSGIGGQTGTGGSDTPSGGSTATGTVLLRADFETRDLGAYQQEMVSEDFGGSPTWNNGLDEGRAVVSTEELNRFLRVTYPAGQYGPSDGGVQFQVAFDKPYEEATLSYRLRFGEAFEWVKGGKLPGLVGGTGPTGCVADDTGFSARMMWRPEGLPVQYLYYPTKQESCGDDFDYMLSGAPASFTPGVWHTVVHRIVMNTPGQKDGVLQAWIDEKLAIDLHDFEWQGTDFNYGINALYFSTFYGGNDATWAPSTDQVIDYDDFVVTVP